MNSTYSILGIPEALGLGFVAVAFFLTVAPYTTGKDFGTFQVPDLGQHARRSLKIIGPVLLCVAVGFFFPLWNLSSLNRVAGKNPRPIESPADMALIVSAVREGLRLRYSVDDKDGATDATVCNYLGNIASEADRLAEVWLYLAQQAESTNSLTKAQRIAMSKKYRSSPNHPHFFRLVEFNKLLPKTVRTQLGTVVNESLVRSLDDLLDARGEAISNLHSYLAIGSGERTRDRGLQDLSQSVEKIQAYAAKLHVLAKSTCLGNSPTSPTPSPVTPKPDAEL